MTPWLLLRGWTREARHWGTFADVLQARLPAGDRVLALDLPGNGQRHGDTSPTRVEDMVQALREDLRQRGESGPFGVVALSLGGMIALHWACTHPRELACCVLVNSSVRGVAPFWQRLRPSSYAALLRLLRPGLSALQRERGILTLTSRLRSHDVVLATQWAAYAQQCPVKRVNVLRQIAAAARFHVPDTAPPVPLLVLASEGDQLVSPQCSRALAQRWTLPVRTHPTAGHDLPLDAPDWVVSEVLRWWKSLRP